MKLLMQLWKLSMLKPEFTGSFKKDYKTMVKRGIDPKKLKDSLIYNYP